MLKSLIVFCLIILLVGSVQAETYYVSSDGDDGNDGLSEDNPWQSLYKASTDISAGDEILLKRGDTWLVTHNKRDSLVVGMGLYITDDNIIVSAYGIGDKPVIDATAQSYAGDKRGIQAFSPVEVEASDVTISNLDLRGPRLGSALQVYYAGDNTIIDNCDISGAGWADESLVYAGSAGITMENCFLDAITGSSEPYSKSIEITGGSEHIIRNNTFRGYGDGGSLRFSNHGTGGLVEQNFFYEPDTRADWAWAIVVRSCNGGTFILRNNVIDMTDHGSFTSNTDLRGVASWYDYAPTTRLIYNNVFISSDGVGSAVEGMGGDAGSVVNMYNNIVVGVEVGFNNDNSNLHLRNNIFYDCDYITENGDEGTNENNIETNPNLVDLSMSNHAATDAVLLSNSPAINAGYMANQVPEDDFLGKSRDSSPDIGAFEYDSGSPDSICGDDNCNGAENCTTCSEDCGNCAVVCIHDADNNPCDGVVSLSELIDYMDSWKTGTVEIDELMIVIGLWKNG